jgi:hypothetical protein
MVLEWTQVKTEGTRIDASILDLSGHRDEKRRMHLRIREIDDLLGNRPRGLSLEMHRRPEPPRATGRDRHRKRPSFIDTRATPFDTDDLQRLSRQVAYCERRSPRLSILTFAEGNNVRLDDQSHALEVEQSVTRRVEVHADPDSEPDDDQDDAAQPRSESSPDAQMWIFRRRGGAEFEPSGGMLGEETSPGWRFDIRD